MDTLTKGFCVKALKGFLPSMQGENWASLWPSPTLQVVDIQRYPKIATYPSVVSRFYLAVSDSASLMWLIIPPRSSIEGLIHTFQIEVGCCITLNDYTIVSAKNGLNVIVPISISYSGTVLSLLGSPVYDLSLFQLSKEALTNRREIAKLGAFHRVVGDCITLNLRDLVETKGQGLSDYAVDVRMVWKGKQRQIQTGASTGRFVFDCIGVDQNGDAISMTFFGSSALHDVFISGDCVRVTNGTLLSRDGAQHAVQLHLGDRSSRVLCGMEADDSIPKLPRRVFGATSVKEVIECRGVGDVVSVEGIVITIFPDALVNTRRGRVERSGFLLRDFASSSYTLDVTLWDEHSRSVKPVVGQRWCFCGFVVREFMNRRTVSSRSASCAFEMQLGDQQPFYPPDSLAVGDAVERDVLQVVLDLEVASETLPVLAKIQRVRLPLTYTACVGCGKEAIKDAHCCAVCKETATEERFLVRLLISDGIRVISAVGFALVGEVLFGLDTPTLLKRRQESLTFEHFIANEVVGLPFLFWLLLPTSSDGLIHIVNCRHMDMTRCAATVMGAVTQMMELC